MRQPNTVPVTRNKLKHTKDRPSNETPSDRFVRIKDLLASKYTQRTEMAADELDLIVTATAGIAEACITLRTRHMVATSRSFDVRLNATEQVEWFMQTMVNTNNIGMPIYFKFNDNIIL